MILAVGGIASGLVIIQLALYIYSTIQKDAHSTKQRELTLELLQQKIAAANAQRVKNEQASHSWDGVRKFVVQKKAIEAKDQCSFYLVPHDGKPLPLFKPGQYLTFKLNIPGRDKPVIRCYSLSDGPRSDYYRVTIKKVPPPRDKDVPPGLISNYFHDHVNEGDILDVQAPRGAFFLEVEERTPAVLIGGGIGITPMMSMLRAITQQNPDRETWLFYGLRSSSDHAFKDVLAEIAEQNENVHLCVCYSRPGENDVLGKDYQYEERVSVDLFKRLLPSSNYRYYLCGPPPLMATLPTALMEWGVPEGDVLSEAFGPASTPKKKKPEKKEDKKTDAATIKISFSRSSKELEWDSDFENLLEFAEENGIQMDSGCRAGNCGTCEVAIKSGKATCTQHGAALSDGSCLTCVSVPDGDLVLDA